jgi:hypothetical protein
MTALTCHSTRESLMAYLASATSVAKVGNSCVATLPIPTVDGRLVDVFVEDTLGDYFVVHDGGKAVNELILQGLRVTDSIAEHFVALATRFGISFTDEMFKATVRSPEIQSMILAVGMCSGLAMGQLVGHVPMAVEEPLRNQFGHTVRGWAKKRFRVAGDVTVKGQYAKHRFDFVAYPKQHQAPTVAMSVLLPGSNSLAAAERFGFKTTDLKSSKKYRDWRRVAIQGRSELWSFEARTLLQRCADVVIELPDDLKLDKDVVKEKLNLAAAA